LIKKKEILINNVISISIDIIIYDQVCYAKYHINDIQKS